MAVRVAARARPAARAAERGRRPAVASAGRAARAVRPGWGALAPARAVRVAPAVAAARLAERVGLAAAAAWRLPAARRQRRFRRHGRQRRFRRYGPLFIGRDGTRAVRFRWTGSGSGSTASVVYEANTLPDTSRWHVSAANSTIGFTPVFVDPFLGSGGLDLEGDVFIDVEISTAGLSTIARATIAIFGRSYNTTTSGSFTWQTFNGTVPPRPTSSPTSLPTAGTAPTRRPRSGPARAGRWSGCAPARHRMRSSVNRVEICFDALSGDGRVTLARDDKVCCLRRLRIARRPEPVRGRSVVRAPRRARGRSRLDAADHQAPRRRPAHFDDREAAVFGVALRHFERMLEQVTGALRIYTAAMGESHPHFHAHMVPRYATMPRDAKAWSVFDLQRAVGARRRCPSDQRRDRARLRGLPAGAGGGAAVVVTARRALRSAPDSCCLLSLCLDLGLVNVAIMRTALNRGARAGFLVGVGSCLGDLAYFVAALIGVAALMRWTPFRWVVWIGGTLVLLSLAAKMIREVLRPRQLAFEAEGGAAPAGAPASRLGPGARARVADGDSLVRRRRRERDRGVRRGAIAADSVRRRLLLRRHRLVRRAARGRRRSSSASAAERSRAGSRSCRPCCFSTSRRSCSCVAGWTCAARSAVARVVARRSCCSNQLPGVNVASSSRASRASTTRGEGVPARSPRPDGRAADHQLASTRAVRADLRH